MTVGIAQFYDQAPAMLLRSGSVQWDAPGMRLFAFILLGPVYRPSRSDEHYEDLFGELVPTAGGYQPQDVDSRAVAYGATGKAHLVSDDASFGDQVTISNARYLVCVQGDHVNLMSDDPLVFYQDLNTEGKALSSMNDEFTVRMPSDGWLQVGPQPRSRKR